MKLYKSDNPDYLYAMKIRDDFVYFGDPWALNMNNSNDRRKRVYLPEKEDRLELRREYEKMVDKSRYARFNNKETFEYYLLYNKDNLKQSILDYQRRFGAYIKICKDKIEK